MSGVEPADPHAALRRDVRDLGTRLGHVLRERGGADLLDTVETVRRLAKESRAGDPSAARGLDAHLEALRVEQALPVARAFAHFLQLANIAEQHHRIRRRRDHQRDPDSGPQRGSVEEALDRLLAEGQTRQALYEALVSQHVDLVLTAHPTEATRRTVLAKLQRIDALLSQRDRPDLTPDESAGLEEALDREILALWETNELRTTRPTPEDEARGGLALIEKVLWDAVPRFLRSLDRELHARFDRGLPVEAAPITFSSWMGGDRDGNPNVRPETTERVVRMGRWVAADLYLREIDALRGELSIDAADADLVAQAGTDREPYRAVLRGLAARLRAARRRDGALLEGRPVPESGEVPLDEVDDLRDVLLACHRSLCAVGAKTLAEGRLVDLVRRVAVFGRDLVRIDLRQESTRHSDALDAIRKAIGLGPYTELSESQRVAWLEAELAQPRPLLPPDAELPPDAADVVETVRMAARLPRTARGAYVISMAGAPSDVLAVHLLQKEAAVQPPMRVVPLFETLDDLQRAPQVVDDLLQCPGFTERSGKRIEVMIGYSDSAKDAGMLAASWALYRAQEQIHDVATRYGRAVTFFHGRGGTVGRGGGPMHAAVGSLPPGTVAGHLRATEQGEVIQARFGLPGIALRSLELYTTAVLEATLDPPPVPEPAWREAMDAMADAACRHYRDVVRADPDFLDLYHAATPQDALGELKIGSRPAKRRASGGLESLRAIPWVFAWTQNRLHLPAWLGVGAGLGVGTERLGVDGLAAAARAWPFLHTTLDLVEMTLAKSEPWVFQHYVERLAPPTTHALAARLEADLRDTQQRLLGVTGHDALLATNPVLRRSIDVRNPYVDPLNLLQVAYLARVRASDDPQLRRALLIAVGGIAQGLRNTG